MKFAEKLAAMLHRRGMTYAGLVKASGTASVTTVQRWVKGGKTPQQDQLAAIARALEVPVAYLADDAIEETADAMTARPAVGADEARYVKIGRALGMGDAADLMVVVSKLGIAEATRRLMLQTTAAASFEDADPPVIATPTDPAPGRHRAGRRNHAAGDRHSAASP